MPGRYELSIEGCGALHQDRFDLAPAEQRDLGAIVLGSSAGIDLEVVDEQRRRRARVDRGRAVPPRRARRRSVPAQHQSHDRRERPLPPAAAGRSRRSFAPRRSRATSAVRSTGSDVRAASLIDPAAPPASIVIPVRTALTLDLDLATAGAVDVLDELELVCNRSKSASPSTWRVKAPPGRYRHPPRRRRRAAAFETWVELVGRHAASAMFPEARIHELALRSPATESGR
jgi:hypothetical protein